MRKFSHPLRSEIQACVTLETFLPRVDLKQIRKENLFRDLINECC